MHRLVFQIIFLALISSITLFAQPRIRIYPRNVLDLGDLYSGQKVEKTVTIRNEGNETLNIKDLKPSCGCTAALLKENKKSLMPSDSVLLSLIFDTKDQAGSVTKSVEVFSNDTANPKVKILFSAFVIERLRIIPRQLYFYVTNPDSDYTIDVTLKNQSKDRPIRILSSDSKFENLKLTLSKTILLPGEEVQLKASLHPKNLDPQAGKIEITTDLPIQDRFEIMVYSWEAGK